MTAAAGARPRAHMPPALPKSPRNWIAVACADHVARGLSAGVMQVGHGKLAPLKRVSPGDRVAYYSPTQVMGERTPLQWFTAIGVVREGEPYAFDMGDGFVPYRRDVAYVDARSAAIHPLLDRLAFAQPRATWGSQFRYGLFSIADADLRVIAEAMNAHLHTLRLSH